MNEIPDIADAVEFRIWASNEPCTFSSLKEELQSLMDDDDYDAAEGLAQEIMEEIQARQLLLKAAYPFECDGYKVELCRPNASRLTYIFCLGLSLLPAGLISNQQRDVQFETVALRAAQSFFGGLPLRIGVPLTAEAPTYEALCDRVIELIPDLGLRSRSAPTTGDAGWDVLIVKGFADKKFPSLIVLGNCATGRTNWMNKGMETAPNYFWQSFTGEHRGVLITFLAVPFVMDEDARLRKLYGPTISFDRLRICEHAPESSQDIAEWIESTRAAALEFPLS
jgi:hypothetical protein